MMTFKSLKRKKRFLSMTLTANAVVHILTIIRKFKDGEKRGGRKTRRDELKNIKKIMITEIHLNMLTMLV